MLSTGGLALLLCASGAPAERNAPFYAKRRFSSKATVTWTLIGAPQGHREAGERDPDHAPGSAEEDVYRRVAPPRLQGRVEQ